MEVIIIAFTFLIADSSAIPYIEWATPNFNTKRLVSGAIESSIEDISQTIKDAGLDPFHIERKSFSYELPVPVIFNCEAFVEEILSTGLSNFKIHKVDYSVITSRVHFDIELPLIHFSAGAVKADGVLFSNKLDYDASGKIDVVSVRVVGQVRVYIGIISGVTVRSITINFTLGDINSDVKLVIMGEDYSDKFNNFMGSSVPSTIKAHYNEINELLEIVLLEIIKANL